MAVSPAVIKAIVVAATDKRTWIFIGSIICGVILMIVGIVAAFLNIFSFDDSGTATAPAAYRCGIRILRKELMMFHCLAFRIMEKKCGRIFWMQRWKASAAARL